MAGLPRPGQVPIFEYRVQVAFDEVDLYGMVHHARYLVYLERSRVDLLLKAGMPPPTEPGVTNGYVVAKAELQYLRPSQLLDELVVHSWCPRLGGASCDIASRISCGGEERVRTRLQLVHLSGPGRLARLPKTLCDFLTNPDHPHACGVHSLEEKTL